MTFVARRRSAEERRGVCVCWWKRASLARTWLPEAAGFLGRLAADPFVVGAALPPPICGIKREKKEESCELRASCGCQWITGMFWGVHNASAALNASWNQIHPNGGALKSGAPHPENPREERPRQEVNGFKDTILHFNYLSLNIYHDNMSQINI